uniref:Uncharacterized protein n=1 Tax=Lactuca sativa TaxID=4236 RepID=A0A9R1UPQ6_LACSA|nr:hypothetical protein LSAT_V11C800395970 [Lactuca sativa]
MFLYGELVNYTLLYINKILYGNSRSLVDFPNLPKLNHSLLNIGSNKGGNGSIWVGFREKDFDPRLIEKEKMNKGNKAARAALRFFFLGRDMRG